MRNIFLLVVLCLAATAGLANAASSALPVYAWNGNEYLFAVQPRGSVTYLTGYRAIGAQWRQVGTTTLRPRQRASEGGGSLQKIWFNGRKIRMMNVDFSSDQFRRGRGGGRR